MDAIHSKEETTRLRTQISDLRGKLNDLENKVSKWVKSYRSCIHTRTRVEVDCL